MTAAVRALTWEIFARYRRVVGGSALYLLAICLVVPLLPEPEAARGQQLAFALIAPLALALGCLVASLTYGEQAQLEGAHGTLPRRLLLLPVGAGVLALVPLAVGLVLFPALWAVLGVWVLRPCGVAVPLAWPGLLAAVAQAWLAALCWMPMPYRWLRLVLLAVWVVAALFGVLMLVEIVAPAESSLVLLMVGLWPPGAALAVAGVRRARSGAGTAEWVPAAKAAAGSPEIVVPFRSPQAALGWLHWRLHGRQALYLALFYVALLLPMTGAAEHALRTKPFLFDAAVAKPTLHQLGPAWAALACLLLGPLIVALAGGGGAALYDPRRARAGLPAFVAVRPVSNETLLRAQFAAAAWQLLLLWGMTLGGAAGWAVLCGHAGDMAESLTAVCGSPALAVWLVLGLVAAVYAGSYLVYVGSMWSGLFGWNIGPVVPVVVNLLLLSLGVGLVVRWVPDWLAWLQGALWAALALELLASAWLVRIILRRRLLRPAALVAGVTVWVALVAPLAAGAAAFGGVTAALTVVVLIPLAQTLLAPLALHFGRHGT